LLAALDGTGSAEPAALAGLVQRLAVGTGLVGLLTILGIVRMVFR
jgi:hypothetical protein